LITYPDKFDLRELMSDQAGGTHQVLGDLHLAQFVRMNSTCDKVSVKPVLNSSLDICQQTITHRAPRKIAVTTLPL
jgi:hypothetical protein